MLLSRQVSPNEQDCSDKSHVSLRLAIDFADSSTLEFCQIPVIDLKNRANTLASVSNCAAFKYRWEIPSKHPGNYYVSVASKVHARCAPVRINPLYELVGFASTKFLYHGKRQNTCTTFADPRPLSAIVRKRRSTYPNMQFCTTGSHCWALTETSIAFSIPVCERAKPSLCLCRSYF